MLSVLLHFPGQTRVPSCFSGTEMISHYYEFQCEFYDIPKQPLDLHLMIPVTIELKQDTWRRCITGIVTRIEKHPLNRYRVTLNPRCYYATLSHTPYQDEAYSLQELLQPLLKACRYDPSAIHFHVAKSPLLKKAYRQTPGESDYDWMCRLLNENRWRFFWKSNVDDEQIVICDKTLEKFVIYKQMSDLKYFDFNKRFEKLTVDGSIVSIESNCFILAVDLHLQWQENYFIKNIQHQWHYSSGYQNQITLMRPVETVEENKSSIKETFNITTAYKVKEDQYDRDMLPEAVARVDINTILTCYAWGEEAYQGWHMKHTEGSAMLLLQANFGSSEYYAMGALPSAHRPSVVNDSQVLQNKFVLPSGSKIVIDDAPEAGSVLIATPYEQAQCLLHQQNGLFFQSLKGPISVLCQECFWQTDDALIYAAETIDEQLGESQRHVKERFVIQSEQGIAHFADDNLFWQSNADLQMAGADITLQSMMDLCFTDRAIPSIWHWQLSTTLMHANTSVSLIGQNTGQLRLRFEGTEITLDGRHGITIVSESIHFLSQSTVAFAGKLLI